MPESGPLGFVRGALSNERPYRDRRFDQGCSLRIEDDGSGGLPVPGLTTPSFGVRVAGALVERVPALEDDVLAAAVALVGSDVPDGAVTVLQVVPGDEALHPLFRRGDPVERHARIAGVCFSVRKRASEYGLSSETCGRLNEGMTPSHCKVAIMVLARMGLPLSECSTRPRGSTFPSRQASVISSDAISAESPSAMRQPTMRRLQTSMTRYRCKYTPRTVVGNQVISQLQT